MVVIRRELPRTRIAGPAMKAWRIDLHEDSPLPCAIPAADPWCLYRVHDDSFRPQAARLNVRPGASDCERSAAMPMAQMKPRSSRPTAVMTCCFALPFAKSFA